MKRNYERLKLEVISFDISERVMMSGADTSSSSNESSGEVGPGNDTVNPSNETY